MWSMRHEELRDFSLVHEDKEESMFSLLLQVSESCLRYSS